MPTPHAHAALIKAWADGAEIQYRHGTTHEWCNCGSVPGWSSQTLYRIKPEPKPDVIKYFNLYLGFGGDCYDTSAIAATQAGYATRGMAKVMFDGETGKAKSVELVDAP